MIIHSGHKRVISNVYVWGGNFNDENETARNSAIHRGISVGSTVNRSDDWTAASSAYHASPACEPKSRLFVDRGLLVSREKPLQMAQRILDSCPLCRRTV